MKTSAWFDDGSILCRLTISNANVKTIMNPKLMKLFRSFWSNDLNGVYICGANGMQFNNKKFHLIIFHAIFSSNPLHNIFGTHTWTVYNFNCNNSFFYDLTKCEVLLLSNFNLIVCYFEQKNISLAQWMHKYHHIIFWALKKRKTLKKKEKNKIVLRKKVDFVLFMNRDPSKKKTLSMQCSMFRLNSHPS